MATWVSRLVQIPSVNPLHTGPKAIEHGDLGERAVAHALATWCADLGAEVVVDPVLDDRPNVYARFPGRTDDLVVIDVHTDTVSVEHMTDPPFDGRIDHGHVWGRGALDTKATHGVLLGLFESWKRGGLKPTPSVMVVGSIAEEAGGLLGAVAFRKWAEAQSLNISRTIVAEPTECVPVHGHKGAVGLKITVLGQAAHSSTPELGRNAISAAAAIVLALDDHHRDLIGSRVTTPMGTGTLLTSVITGGVAPNIVPDRCVLTVGRRIVPGEVPGDEYDRISTIARAASPLPLEIEPTIAPLPGDRPGSPAFFTSADSAFVAALAHTTGNHPQCATFGTNALRYDGFGGDKVVFGPGSIDDAHQATERVAISDLHRLADVYTQLLQPR